VLLTGSPDCSIVATDVETGQAVARLTGAHGAAINRIINATDWSIASGDDEGTIKVWDTRQNVCCSSFKAHDDFVADMEFVPDSMQLLGARLFLVLHHSFYE
jgi:WD40 repeat protein